MTSPGLLTLRQVARMIGVEYRTLHSWLGRGLLRPSVQFAGGSGVPNLFSARDAVRAKVVADLRHSGLSFEKLGQASIQLEDHATALTEGAMLLVNDSVSVLDDEAAYAAIKQDSPTLVYDTAHAVRNVTAAMPASSQSG
jgi:DNA-binding transcriptional MerR regulator